MTAGAAGPRKWWCRKCEEPLTISGPGGVEHAATGSPLCADGTTIAVPDRTDPVKRHAARQLQEEFPEWRVTLPFNGLYFRADFRDPPLGVTMTHYLDDDADGLRRQLAAATARTAR